MHNAHKILAKTATFSLPAMLMVINNPLNKNAVRICPIYWTRERGLHDQTLEILQALQSTRSMLRGWPLQVQSPFVQFAFHKFNLYK